MDLRRAATSPAAFRAELKLPGSRRRLADALDPWQARDFANLDASWLAAAGRGPLGPYRRAWLERPRGHSKTSDLAVSVLWALLGAHQKISGIAAAADVDQAALLRRAAERLIESNGLGSLFTVTQRRIENVKSGSSCELLSSDAGSSFGLLPDFLILDEIVHWTERAEELWHSLLSAAAKRPSCLLVSISNAGWQSTWQHRVRQQVLADDAWYFSRLSEPCASWLDAEALEEQQRLLPDVVFRRLWLNQWTSGEQAALTEAELQAARAGCVEPGGPRGWVYAAGLDLGLKRDASSLVIVRRHIGVADCIEVEPQLTARQKMLIDAGVLELPEPQYQEHIEPASGRVVVELVSIWRGSRERPVDVAEIERAIVDAHQRYGLSAIGVDPWQAQFLMQRLQKLGLPARPVDFTPTNLKSMATVLVEHFRSGTISIPEALANGDQLARDLGQLRLVEREYGTRLDAKRTAEGHADSAVALAIALHVAAAESQRAAPSIIDRPLAYC